MRLQNKSLAAILGAGILLAGVLPLVLYWPAFHQPVQSELSPVHNVGLLEQWLVVITAFGVKPTYMLLSLLWIIWLWRSQAADLVALRWGFIWFLGGEIACTVNFVCLRGHSAITDYLHGYGMAVGFSFVAYAALEGMDSRVIKCSPPNERCAALSLCRACIKHAAVPCGLHRFFALLIPALIAVALMLPCVPVQPVPHRVTILNSVQDFSNPLWSQLFEGRYCPWLAVALLLLSWAALLFKREDPVATAMLLFAAALGPLGFGFMRVFPRTAYAENLAWSNIWEELTELIFVLGVGWVLWLFRQSLFRVNGAATVRSGPEAPSLSA